MQMLYVDNVITSSVFLEIMWNSTLLIHYKLNSFRPPGVKQFGICALLFVFYAKFIPL